MWDWLREKAPQEKFFLLRVQLVYFMNNLDLAIWQTLWSKTTNAPPAELLQTLILHLRLLYIQQIMPSNIQCVVLNDSMVKYSGETPSSDLNHKDTASFILPVLLEFCFPSWWNWSSLSYKPLKSTGVAQTTLQNRRGHWRSCATLKHRGCTLLFLRRIGGWIRGWMKEQNDEKGRRRWMNSHS